MLYLHGIGSCAVEDEATAQETGGQVPKLPLKEHFSGPLRRKMGRLAKMFYIAASRALQDTQTPLSAPYPMVGATGYGELDVAIKFLRGLTEQRGKHLSPIAVQNAVHNAPLGYLGIGQQNTGCALTISQGWLSAEAALQAVHQMMYLHGQRRGLVVCGDVYLPAWIDALRKANADAEADALAAERLHEGAVACVVGLDPPATPRYGRLREALVVHRTRWDGEALRASFGEALSQAQGVTLRDLVGGEQLSSWLADTEDHGPLQSASPVISRSLAGVLLQLRAWATDPSCEDLVLLGHEHGDVGMVWWQRT